MTTLAIDTSGPLCAAAIHDGDRELSRAVLDLGKGHAEHLMAVIEDALKTAKLGYGALQAIAVSVGPGSFTGVRVGVSTARGLALALKIPAIGVSTMEAVAEEARRKHPGRAILAAFTSGRGEIQAALYDPFANLVYHPAVIDLASAVQLATGHAAVVAGSASRLIAAENPNLIVAGEAATADIGTYAQLALAKEPTGEKPKPLYLREPDAKPQASFVLPRAGR